VGTDGRPPGMQVAMSFPGFVIHIETRGDHVHDIPLVIDQLGRSLIIEFHGAFFSRHDSH